MKKFYLNSLLILLLLFFNSILVQAVSVGVDLSVVDTVLGEDTFYSFELIDEGLVLDGELLMALRKPDMSLIEIRTLEFKDIDWMKPYRIDSEDISVSGNYDLFLLRQGERYSDVLMRDGFEVVDTVVDANDDFDVSKWFQGSLFGIGGDEILLAQAEINRFDIDDLPSIAELQSPITFTVQALDEAQENDFSYNGTIKIEVLNDVNSVTPNDYTFVLQDAGEHRFVDSLIFNSVGTKTIKITDVDDPDMTAEFNIEVIDSDAEPDEGTLLQIESPISTVYSENRILVKGNTEPGLEVIVLEGGAEFLRFDAEVDGGFTELLPPLEDGVYSLQFQVNDTLSQIFQLEIRTGGVDVRLFNLSSDSVSPVELIDVELELTASANSASVIMNGIKTDLFKQDVTGTYFTGQITAPSSAGSYSINLIIVDDLGSTTTVDNVESIVVGGELVNDNDETLGSPGISNLRAESLDRRVRLSWSEPSGLDVIFYTVKYGQNPSDLNLMVDTNTVNPEWFVPGLSNDVVYYFQVFAVNSIGDEVAGSDIIQATAGRPENTNLMGASDVSETSDTGAGLIFILMFSVFVSWYWRGRSI